MNSSSASARPLRSMKTMIDLPYRDRYQAGRMLGTELSGRRPAPTVVLALARGGVPVGAEVANVLRAQFDIVVVRKLGVPWQPELAMGAIAGTTKVLDFRLILKLRISDDELEEVVTRESEELARREKLYRDGLPAIPVRDRSVAIVDDGLATGSTMIAAVRHVRSLGPKKLIVAVPVGSAEACSRLSREADECVCLATPEPFSAVGEWYSDFRQVSDAEVREILKGHRSVSSVA